MALTVGEAVERTFLRVSKGLSEAQAKLYRYAIQAMLPDALNTLAQMAPERPDFKLEQKVFTVTLSSGVGALPSNMAIHTIHTQGSVKDGAGTLTYALQYVPSLQDLDFTPNDEFVRYTIAGGASVGAAIHIKAGSRAIATPTTLTVRAGVFPTLAGGYSLSTTFTDLPTQMQDDLVEILVQMVMKGEVDRFPAPTGDMAQ